MAMATHKANAQIRRSQFDELVEISKLLPPLATTTLSPQDLQDARIDLRKMSLVPIKNELKRAQYCEPISIDDLSKGLRVQDEMDEENTRVWPSYNPEWAGGNFYMALQYASKLLKYAGEFTYPWCGLANTHWSYQGRTTRLFPYQRGWYDDERSSDQQYRVIEIPFATDTSQPHVACVLCDDAPANDAEEGLKGSELLCALSLMKGCVKRDREVHFRQHPVYVYSFSDCNARVLEAHHEETQDGKLRIVVRKTEYLDLRQAEKDGKKGIRKFLSWMLSTPLGKTMFSAIEVDLPAPRGQRKK